MKLFQRSPAVPEVSPAEASKRVDDGNAVLVDVREAFEWQVGRAAPARHIPLGDLQAQLEKLPRDKDVMVICASGNRSKKGARILQEAGFTAASVSGGTAAWARAGLAIKR
jgi:rhodanese-related sulfurtransferase